MFSSECGVFDMVLVLDASDSVGKDNWQKIVKSMAAYVSYIEIGKNRTHIGAVSFGMQC